MKRQNPTLRPDAVAGRWPRRAQGRPDRDNLDQATLETLHAIALIQHLTGRAPKRREISRLLWLRSTATAIMRVDGLRRLGLATSEYGSLMSLRLTAFGLRCLRRCPACGAVGEWAPGGRWDSEEREGWRGLSAWLHPSPAELRAIAALGTVDELIEGPILAVKPLWYGHDCAGALAARTPDGNPQPLLARAIRMERNAVIKSGGTDPFVEGAKEAVAQRKLRDVRARDTDREEQARPTPEQLGIRIVGDVDA